MESAKNSTVSGRIYRYNLALTLTAVLISGALSLYLTLAVRQNDYDRTIQNVACFVSELDIVRSALGSGTPFGDHREELTESLDLVRSSFEEIDLLVLCDDRSIRYYHNDLGKVGELFQGDDQAAILSGQEPYISEAEGTLGMQRRAFFPVTDGSGKRIGFVMCSVLTSSLTRIRSHIIGIFLCLLLALSALGVLLSRAVTNKMRKLFMGHQPEEFRRLYIERTEVIDALDEGIIAINQESRIILINRAARHILKLPEDAEVEGVSLPVLFPEARLQETLESGETRYNTNQVIQKQTVLSSHIPIVHRQKIVGAAAILRDKSEAEKLAEELTGTRHMVDTLRAFNHEFMNKLHIILGFLEMKEVDKAKAYILETSLVSGEAVSHINQTVPLPNLAALLIGKLIRASELGIRFSLKSDSHFYQKEVELPVDCLITLVGNLLENAMDELNREAFPVKKIELGIYSENGHTMITCDDTGGGIPENILASIYDRNTTTKGPGHGTGFALIREVVDCYGGTIQIDTELGLGTSIEITLPV